MAAAIKRMLFSLMIRPLTKNPSVYIGITKIFFQKNQCNPQDGSGLPLQTGAKAITLHQVSSAGAWEHEHPYNSQYKSAG
jgi:hypothetical protein